MQLTTSFILSSFALTAAALPNPSTEVKRDYVPGECGVHVVHFQTNPDRTTKPYRLSVVLKDALQRIIGGVVEVDAPSGQPVNVNSELPYVFIATTGNVDDDPIKFAYSGQSWDSNSGQCSVGGYEDGNREMDCSFSC